MLPASQNLRPGRSDRKASFSVTIALMYVLIRAGQVLLALAALNGAYGLALYSGLSALGGQSPSWPKVAGSLVSMLVYCFIIYLLQLRAENQTPSGRYRWLQVFWHRLGRLKRRGAHWFRHCRADTGIGLLPLTGLNKILSV
jgi:hypothetical protein